MKRISINISLCFYSILFCLFTTIGLGQTSLPGTPIVKNYFPSEYNGHTQNFDVAQDTSGNIYVANFAGIIVFNGSSWDRVLTPDISRVSCLESDENGKIYVGGLNEIGRLQTNSSGKLVYEDLRPLIKNYKKEAFGEVKNVIAFNGIKFFFTRDKIFILEKDTIAVKSTNHKITRVEKLLDRAILVTEELNYLTFDFNTKEINPALFLGSNTEITAATTLNNAKALIGTARGLRLLENDSLSDFASPLNQELEGARITDIIKINDNVIAIGTSRNGVFFMDPQGNELTHINRAHGLQNDYVNQLFLDDKNRLWAALNNGISLIGYPWPWTIYTRNNGLKSGVISIIKHQGELLAGTYQGLYKLEAKEQRFNPIEGIETACWDFHVLGDRLFVATSEGVFMIYKGQIEQVSSNFSLDLCQSFVDPNTFYAGTIDGVNKFSLGENSDTLELEVIHSELGEVTKVLADRDGFVWVSTMDGQLSRFNERNEKLQTLGESQNLPSLLGNQFFEFDSSVIVGTTEGLLKFDRKSQRFEKYSIAVDSTNGAITWPGLLMQTSPDVLWVTLGDETGISNYLKTKDLWTYNYQATGPFQDFICRSIYKDQDGINWFGGPSGLIRMDSKMTQYREEKSEVKLAKIQLNTDSIYYGGHGERLINQRHKLDYSQRNITFYFGSDGFNADSDVLYSYKLKGLRDQWSDWTKTASEEYQKLSPGSYSFSLKAKDVYGNETSKLRFDFEILSPWYQKWYMFIVYVLLAAVLIWQFVQLRLKKLVKEKQKLENTIRDRTSEIRNQRDEIQLKSEELGTALADLKNTQNELIRQEKMASVGQMTKGIVDRMINPLNYINNFSSLSKDLANEIKEVLENERDSISQEGYDEILDIGSMLELNLGKIQEHGGSTVRIVKGMEELLKDRSGKYTEVDIKELTSSVINNINSEHKEDFNKHGIELSMSSKGSDFVTKVISPELTKAVHELFDNASQSVIATCEKNGSLGARVIGEIESVNGTITLRVKDNGMGIPEREKNKIFDPFFTTKPTAKGSGVGLYLVREIILSHKGSISVESEVNKETSFTMTLPIIKEVKPTKS